jgi:hypothetical protein
MKKINATEVADFEATIYEEDSYSFLYYYQTVKDWTVYDSHALGIPTVSYLTELFATFHGKVPFPDDFPIQDSFWSSVPLGVFRFKLHEDMSCGIVLPGSKTVGYIVEGCYWDNGFFYSVRDNSEIVQVKLFIDPYTKETHSYPNPSQV